MSGQGRFCWLMLLGAWPVFSQMIEEPQAPSVPAFENAMRSDHERFTDAEAIRRIDESLPKEYLLGPGDVVEIEVLDQPDLSGRHTIGPDGTLTLPLVGELAVESLTRGQAAEAVREALSEFYRDPMANLRILEYHNNHVYVLGRVSNPGLITFKGRPNLLEALSLAGAIPVLDSTAQLTKCAVIRGKHQIIWIDLKELLQGGNLTLNLRLANKDVIFIPDGGDALVYVMGEVRSPGAYRITAGMSFLDALMLAGGMTLDGKQRNVALIRNEQGEAKLLNVNMAEFREGDFAANMLLKENDIIYVHRKKLAKLNYILRQISPFTQWFLLDRALSD